MRQSRRVLALLGVVGTIALPRTSFAQNRFVTPNTSVASTLVISTLSGSFSFDDAARGQYEAGGTQNGNAALNSFFTGQVGVLNFRSWMAFNLSSLVNQTITGATLQFKVGAFTSPVNNETFELWDVSTTLSTLGVATGTGIFDDLGSGTLFGSRVFTNADVNQTVQFTLNSAGLSAISSAQGSNLGIGGALKAPTTVPEPSTYLLLASGLVALAIARASRDRVRRTSDCDAIRRA